MKRLLADKRNIWYVCGMLVGFVAIIMGINYLTGDYSSAFTHISDLEFGGDFYTEIYKLINDLRDLLRSLDEIRFFFTNEFGVTLILAGIVDICAFGSKINLAKKEQAAEDNDSTQQ